MFKIGEFARFSRVSVKMLRHYDELGLLQPAHVDPETNYRYYTVDQLPQLHRIVALKDLGFSLAQIAGLLQQPFSTETLRGMLTLRQAELAQQLAETAVQLRQVEVRLAQLADADVPSRYDIVMRGVAAQMVACIRLATSADDQVTQAFETLEAHVAKYQARAPLPPLIRYLDQGFDEDSSSPALEVLIPISRPLPVNGRITLCELPAHETVACVVHSGPYSTLPHAYAALLGWIERNDFEIVSPLRELYLRFGADQDAYRLPEAYLAESADQFVTELQAAVRRRQHL